MSKAYRVSLAFGRRWKVGYHPEKNEIFLFFKDEDGLFWAFRRGILDAVGFSEFVKTDHFVILGDL